MVKTLTQIFFNKNYEITGPSATKTMDAKQRAQFVKELPHKALFSRKLEIENVVYESDDLGRRSGSVDLDYVLPGVGGNNLSISRCFKAHPYPVRYRYRRFEGYQ